MRERAVRLVLESGRPIAVVAADLGVGTESLRTWVRRARADGGAAGAGLTSSERDELAGLRCEVKDLRRANEILKAASVFFGRYCCFRGWADGGVGGRMPRRA
jgi:transposase